MGEPKVYGLTVDEQTRCQHYATELDIVALKFGCCERYYPCYKCHDETAEHSRQPWPANRADEPAVLCGVCKTQLSTQQYLGQDRCPTCASSFNPACRAHYDLYFER
ncbi:MAG TPA: CHY zinc finger protein [Enteractinococcus sp.]